MNCVFNDFHGYTICMALTDMTAGDELLIDYTLEKRY